MADEVTIIAHENQVWGRSTTPYVVYLSLTGVQYRGTLLGGGPYYYYRTYIEGVGGDLWFNGNDPPPATDIKGESFPDEGDYDVDIATVMTNDYSGTDIISEVRGANYDLVIAKPTKATNTSPTDAEVVESWDSILDWGNGGGAVNYVAYIGTESANGRITPWSITATNGYQTTTYTLSTNNVDVAGQNDFDYTTPWPPDDATLYWKIDSYNEWGATVGDTWSFEPASVLPDKAITPGPTHENIEVTLDHENLTWIDGGLGESNEATHFNVYYGTASGALTLVSSGQAAGVASNLFTVWGVEYGSPYDYAVTRYWRIDSTNGAGTTTGDEWSFTTLSEGYVPPYPPPRPDDYDPDTDVTGGGRFGTTLLAISNNSDVGVIYYRTV